MTSSHTIDVEKLLADQLAAASRDLLRSLFSTCQYPGGTPAPPAPPAAPARTADTDQHRQRRPAGSSANTWAPTYSPRMRDLEPSIPNCDC